MSFPGSIEIVRLLDSGGMSELHLARRTSPGGGAELVVVKRLLGRFAREPEVREMFAREARLTMSLDHPGIARTYGMGETDGTPFLVMEYVHGHHLEEIQESGVQRAMPLPLDLVCHVVSSVCQALHHVHTLPDENGAPWGIVHRDINPRNVLLSFAGEVKLVDFGVAKTTKAGLQTKGARLKGTYAYMSPEQCRGETVNTQSDIFSVGIVLYELCCRRRLFRRHSEFATLRAILDDPIPPPCSVSGAIPASLEAVIMRAMARDPGQRFAGADAMAEALQAVAREQGWQAGSAQAAAWMDRLFPGEAGRPGSPVPREAGDDKVATIDLEMDGELPKRPAPHLVRAKDPPPSAVADRVLSPALEPLPAMPGAQQDLETDERAQEPEEVVTIVCPPSFDDIVERADPPDSIRSVSPFGPLEVDRRQDPVVTKTDVVAVPPPSGRLRKILLLFVVLLLVGAAGAGGLLLYRSGLLRSEPLGLHVSSVPSGATVFLNGQRQFSPTPSTLLDLAPDREHKLVLDLEGYVPWQRMIRLTRGQGTSRIAARLVPRDGIGRGLATLVVTASEEGARVYLDGELRGLAPLTLRRVPCGRRHELVVQKEGFESFSVVVQRLRPQEMREVSVKLRASQLEHLEKGIRSGGGGLSPGELKGGPVEVPRTDPLAPLRERRIGETVPEP